MPTIDGKWIEPDDAVAKGLCPECGQNLAGVDKLGHANRHYPKLDPEEAHHAVARKRRAQIIAMAP